MATTANGLDEDELLESAKPAAAGVQVPGAAPGVTAPPGTQMFPELEVRHKDGPDVTSTVTAPALAPAQLDAIKGRQTLSAGEKSIADEQYKQNQALHAVEAKASADQAAEFQRQEAERQKAIEKSQAGIDDWTDRLRIARDRYDAAPLPSLFGDKSTGGKVLMSLGLALGALGSAASAQANARLGGGGQAPDTVGDIIKNDLDRQRQNIKELTDRVVMAKTGLSDANEARKLMLADVDVRGAIASKKIAAIAKANLDSQGMAGDAITKHQAYQDADKNAQEYMEKAVAGLTETHTTASQTEADTTTTRTGQDKNAGKDNLASLRRDRIAANIAEYNKANTELEKLGPNVITPDVLDIVQKNETELHAAESAHGALGAAGVAGGRMVGVIPKSRYDGLTDEQAKAMQAVDTMLQHGSEMQPSTGAEVSEQWKGTNRPKAGTSQEIINERLQHLKQAGKDYKAIIDPTNIGGRADVPAPGAVPTEAPPPFLQKPAAIPKNSVTNLKATDVADPDDPNGPNASTLLEEDPAAEELPAPSKALPSMRTLQGKAGQHAPVEAPLKASAKTYTPAVQKVIDLSKKAGIIPPPEIMNRLHLTPEDFR